MVTSGLNREEEVCGFGEQFRDFDLVGATFGVLVQEQGIGREQPITSLADLPNRAGANLGVTYAAWPTYVTSENRSFALTNDESSGGFVVANMQTAGAEISGVWLQDWAGKRTTSFGSHLWWTWQLDEQQYPGWDELVADLNAEGIEVLTYVVEMVVTSGCRLTTG